MKILLVCAAALTLTACNKTSQTAALSSPSPPTANVSLQELPSIYDPLIDRHGVKESKYERDLAQCRAQAAPQEKVARAAAQQAQTGAALSAVGSVLDVIPANTFKQAQALGATSAVLQTVGDANAVQGTVTAESALADYALVVNTCLRHRNYVLLR